MPSFEATYSPRGIDVRPGIPDPEGSTHFKFSAPSYREAVRRAKINNPDDSRLRKIIRVDGSRESTIYEIAVTEGKRRDGEDFSFGVVKAPAGVLV